MQHPRRSDAATMRARRPARVALATAIVLAFLAALPALAQDGPRSRDLRFGEQRNHQSRNSAGDFDYYALVLSWSPTHCAALSSGEYDPQCHRRDGRRYAFVLHGLWPQHERGYPEYCQIRGRPFVPQPLIDSLMDIMPSPKLAIHEYRKHGTCSGLDPSGYYALARRLYKSIRIPDRYVNPFEAQFVSPDALADELMTLNPEIKPDMLAVSCGGPGNRLREVRICYSKDGVLRACGTNEDQRRLCRSDRMYVPPVRSSRTDRETPDERRQGPPERNPLPGPRVIESPRSL